MSTLKMSYLSHMGANMLHDVHQWRSLPEVDTWLMSFNMTCFAL
jgi:hypothetical protein